MKQSLNPKIAVLAKLNLNSLDYWNDLSDIENLLIGKFLLLIILESIIKRQK